MTKILDIAPLRSLVAVADCGGFQRAADHLHLSQGAVSQHVRRLEGAVGTKLVEKHGRGSRFTAGGERLVGHARQILAAHDDTLRAFAVEEVPQITIGSTEHAAAQLLPALAAALDAAGSRFRFRIDRGTRLREGLAAGSVDLALMLNTNDPDALVVGDLDLAWYSSPTWAPPVAPAPVPVVAFDSPCTLRSRALETLAAHGVPAVIGAEAIQLAGVQAAVGAGLGVALMATLGQTPEGLVRRDDLPTPEPIRLHVCSRPGLPTEAAEATAAALRPLLAVRSMA
ncbi:MULTISPECIES: LysR family transcriptional regulator [unclassified Nocardioides]|jgi:DNA-binding transcriptional LysR family regulator|uniref:LysR family transcriptional regulator n=1 Tax=unclassified Nocardioides TaxID=2615069 RepID=UPI000702F825|nr:MULTISPECIES: LysR family transcriptional regulator [unclassified Nocardioides]KRC52590.1 LysR family transcriptional regulator [Nocardioides sp. Root79]KRC72121.1 LysR family transcriptional regulator [Nocardioides sp. Root240]